MPVTVTTQETIAKIHDVIMADEKRSITLTWTSPRTASIESSTTNFIRLKAPFVIMDETWVHLFQPETKQQSKQLKHLVSPPPNEAKTGMYASKVMASIWWDAEGVLLVDYIDNCHSMSGAYHAYLPRESYGRKANRFGVESFHNNNTSLVAMAAIQKCRFQLVENPTYSHDLAPFPKVTKVVVCVILSVG